MLVGIIADTHIPHRLKAVPQAVFEIFSEVDLILHAGDIVDPRILDDLASLAPVKAVRGNVHLVDRSWDPQLPKAQRLHILGHHIVLTHGHGSFVRGSLERVRYWLSPDRDLVNQRIANWCLDIYPEADLIIFGHSHRPYNQTFGQRLLFNPGAVCPTEGEIPSVALLTIEREKVSGELVELT